MGVDLATYRSRIGSFHYGIGIDVITVSVHINLDAFKNTGTVIFVGILLLIAGIEPNPGPNLLTWIVTILFGCLIPFVIYLVCHSFRQEQNAREGERTIKNEADLRRDEDTPNGNQSNNDKIELSHIAKQGDATSQVDSIECSSDDSNRSISVSASDSVRKRNIQADSNSRTGVMQDPEREIRDACEDTLNLLGLKNFFPCKMTCNDVMAVGEVNQQNTAPSDLPVEMLKGLIMMNYKVRDDLPHKVLCKDEEDKRNPFDSEDNAVGKMMINCQDIFMAIFNCCHSILKQKVINKMFLCRLAIPIIYKPLSCDELCFSIWPLRSTAFEIEYNDTTEASLVKHPMTVVSVLRYGRPNLSKSKVINEILSDESHSTFYHRDCPLGTTDRKLANGIVEASWYLPSGKQSDIFKDVLMFFNLRGDANQHVRQTQIMKNISSIVIIFMDYCDAEKYISYIKDLSSEVLTIILVLTCDASTAKAITKQQTARSFCLAEIPSIKIIQNYKNGKEKNASDLKLDIRVGINMFCSKSKLSIEECARCAQTFGIKLDEENPILKTSKTLSDLVMVHVNDKKTIPTKETLLPLQGELWEQWSKINKENKKHGKVNLLEEQWKISLQELRQRQGKLCENITPFLKSFVEILIDNVNNQDLISHFLLWLKFHFDERSRAIIPPLTSKYHECWQKFKSIRDKEQQINKDLKEAFAKAEKDMVDASFGLEHIFRELGQYYEAAKESPLPLDNYTTFMVDRIPSAFANLLLLGFPLEIMDGDAGNIPCRWVTKVLNSLNDIIGNKKVLVLSILGVQSSGKSTFLNTMFGLQFAVSAGRCTRGIFLQLLPVKPMASTSTKFDYILVLDTEGIRAPEFGIQKFDHDNELATLVLGMGDVTIINIKGENTTEINDVLQIAVHAFIRLNLANQNLNLQQSCVFVHQNVAAMNAERKLQQCRQNLVQNLDDMTEIAAKQESLSNVTTFKQVIEFDSQENVWYMPDLWLGDPPMAYVNPGYSMKVLEIREALLTKIRDGRSTFLSISETSTHITDLWNGILADNFVFSFRNSLEVKVYSKMEAKYQSLNWEVERHTATLLATLKAAIKGTETQHDLRNKVFNSFEEEVRKKAKELEEELIKYFNNNEYADIICQWKETQVQSLRRFTRDILNKSIGDMEQIHKEKKVGIKTELKNTDCVEEITEKATDLAQEFKGEEPSESELNRRFNVMWTKWTSVLPTTVSEERVDIVKEAKKILFNKHVKLQVLLSDEMGKHPLSEWNTPGKLTDNFHFECKVDNHISIKKYIMGKFINKAPVHQCLKKAKTFTLELLNEIEVYLESVSKSDVRFEQFHLTSILQKVEEKITIYENEGTNEFTFLPPYKSSILVYICRFAVHEFNAMNARYDKRHSPRSKIDAFKDTTWNLFVNIVSEKSNEMVAANLFCDVVGSLIKKKLEDDIPLDIIGNILRSFEYSKHRFIVHLLDELAEKNDFNCFMKYSSYPQSYALQWLINHVKTVSFTKTHGTTLYAKYAKIHIEKIIDEIEDSFFKAITECKKKKCNEVENVLVYLKENCTSFKIVSDVEMRRMRKFNFHEIDDFRKLTLQRLAGTKETLLKLCEDVLDVEWKLPIHTKVIDRLWGCDQFCPFCHEPCQKMKHESNVPHTCLQHRPSAVTGIRDVNTRKLVVESCSFKVQTTIGFNCAASGNRCRLVAACPKKNDIFHPFKDYKIYLPDWDITPSNDQSSSTYWNWFTSNFKTQLKEYHGAELPSVPNSWSKIGKEEAKTSLRSTYL